MHSTYRLTVTLASLLLLVPLLVNADERAASPQDQLHGAGVAAGQGAPQAKVENGISYISGGAGSDEAKALDRIADPFNFKLTTSTPSGQYTSPSTIRIDDSRGIKVLEVRPNGPIFLAKLPSGGYTVQATAEGQTMTRKVTVRAAGMEAITMTWPAATGSQEAGDAPR